MPETAPASNPTSDLDLSGMPVRVDRRTAAAIVTRHFFPVSHRSLEKWPLRLRRVNGRALIEVAELIAVARARVEAAPVIRSGSLSSDHASHLAA